MLARHPNPEAPGDTQLTVARLKAALASLPGTSEAVHEVLDALIGYWVQCAIWGSDKSTAPRKKANG